ncbi:hypothetical protein WJX74_000376 [Apatococcus lobatus]|uniref:Lipid-binding serum glycoprotein C-terminal domain-containing protein n=1 Tax=Apatococcus lobatus TaxID=904363 RepID=A0AAW1RRN5_9CHLO
MGMPYVFCRLLVVCQAAALLRVCGAGFQRSSLLPDQSPGILDLRSAADLAIPSVSGIASAQLFKYASAVAIGVLTEQYPHAKLPAVQKAFRVPVLGTFHLTVDEIAIGQLSLDPDKTGIALSPDGSKLVLSAAEVTSSATCHFHLVRHPFSSSGHAEIRITRGHLTLDMQVQNDGTGRPWIVVPEPPSVGFEGLDITVSGSKLAALYNIIAQLAEGPIRGTAVRELQFAAATSLPDAVNHAFSTLPTLVDARGFELNISMAGSPRGDGAGHITFQDWGIFQNPKGQPWQCPIQQQSTLDAKSTLGPQNKIFKDTARPSQKLQWSQAASLPAVQPLAGNRSSAAPVPALKARLQEADGATDQDTMLRFAASESLLNCFSWAAQTQGLLNQTLQGPDILGQFARTDAWWAVVPQLASDYPNQELALHLWDPLLPHTSIHGHKGIITTGTGSVSFHLAPPANSSQSPQEGGIRGVESSQYAAALGKELFALEVGASVTVTKLELSPDDSVCPGGLRLDTAVQVDHSSLSVKVVDSQIGRIGPLGLQLGLQLAAAAIEAQMNLVILKDGFLLPCAPHFRPANTSLHLEPGTLVLQTDIQYYHSSFHSSCPGCQ